MEIIYNILPENILNALGWTVLHSLWQAFVVALLLAAYLLIGQQENAKKRYWASCAAMGTTLLLSVITFFVLLEKNEVTAALSNKVLSANGLAFGQYSIETQQATFAAYFDKNMPLIVTVWLMGMLFFLLKTLGGLLYIQRLKTRHLSPVPEQWQAISDQFQTVLGISKKVKLAASALVKTPMVVGWLKPVILMPVAAINQLSTEQVEAILAHELAHVARYDYFINILQTIVEALFYFNPAVWWISARIRTERENCCDDIAVATCGNSIAYAKALVSLQEMQAVPPMFALAFSKNKNLLLSRIQRILQSPAKKSNVMEKITVTGLLLAAVLMLSVQAKSPFVPSLENEENSFVEDLPQTEQSAPRILRLPANDTLPPHLMIHGDGILKIEMKNGDEIELEMAEGNGDEPIIKSVTRNGEPVPKEEYDNYRPENLSADGIANINVSKTRKTQRNNFRYKNKSDDGDIDLEMKGGKINRLKIDGKVIDEADYPEYEGLVEELLDEVPEPPVAPSPPHPPHDLRPPLAPRAPMPPSAISPTPPVPPTPPAPPSPNKRTRKITTENNGSGMTIIIEGGEGVEPVEIEIENRKKGNVVINGNEIKGLKKGDKTVIVERLDGTVAPLPFVWGGANNGNFWFNDDRVAVVPDFKFEHEYEFVFPDPSDGETLHLDELLKEHEDGNAFYFAVPDEKNTQQLKERMADRKLQKKELMERIEQQQKEYKEYLENNDDRLQEHKQLLEKAQQEKIQLFKEEYRDQLQGLNEEAERLFYNDKIQKELKLYQSQKVEELMSKRDFPELAEYLKYIEKLKVETDLLDANQFYFDAYILDKELRDSKGRKAQ